jgi:putative inorganic carbon (HCO3(-)) transporter
LTSDLRPLTSAALPADSAATSASSLQPSALSKPLRSVLPARLRRLLWLLTINAALVSLVGMAQRASGTDKVLWLVTPRIPAGAFGPYNYQSNAAQYFNLVWPISLGFWWTLRRGFRRGLRSGGRFGRWGHHVLLPCTMITAIGPLISNSKAGAIVGTANIVVATAILLLTKRRREGLAKLGVYLLFVTTLLLGVYFGWSQLGPRMEQMREAYESREHIYRTARGMAEDCPVFGTGPGTFEPLFQLYRSSTDEYWPAQLHND